MNTRRNLARLLTLLASFALIGAMLSFTSASAATKWKPRAEQYAKTVVEKDVAIPMSDGTILRGDVERPADAAGKAIDKRFPVIVTITAYNKTILGSEQVAAGQVRVAVLCHNLLALGAL